MRVLILATIIGVVCLATSARAEQLTLDQIQTIAETQAPRLRLARQAVELARAELVAADPSVPDNPTLELAGGPRFASDGTSYAFDLTFMQSVFVGGERGARITAAKKAVIAAEAQVQVARWSLHADIHQTFDRALIARQRVALSSEVEGFQRRLTEIAMKKAKAGEIATIDARLTEVELAEARQHMLAAKHDYRVACLQLAALVGSADTALEPAGELETPGLPPLSLLLSRAHELEPERHYKLALVELAKARLAAEERAGSITPGFGVNVGHEGGIANEPGITTVQAIVSIPLPTSHDNQGNIARARAALRQAEVERDVHDQWIATRITELHETLAAAIERSAVFGDAILPRITENLVLLERAYAVGELDLASTILARERFIRVRLDALDAHAARLGARAELERILGSDLPESLEVTP